MGLEIERKFLVNGNGWRRRVTGSAHIVQGYLARDRKSVIRVRIKDGKSATLTIKSRDKGARRAEFEYPIPLKDARDLLQLAGSSRIEKTRHTVPHGQLVWEIDVFEGREDKLILAEIELPNEDAAVKLPGWLGAEVTADPRYRNSSLAAP
ncbi:MAG: CYTH domain-containing protein [Hyphomicrobiales bacterium]|nr:MAG: CYTH domain-containing protein [Hyphomicrobiales bacterium]